MDQEDLKELNQVSQVENPSEPDLLSDDSVSNAEEGGSQADAPAQPAPIQVLSHKSNQSNSS
jgi:hypothetical protein